MGEIVTGVKLLPLLYPRANTLGAVSKNRWVVTATYPNYNDYGVVARAAYEVTPALVPFAELAFDDRIHDNAIDISGYYRNSIGIVAHAGATVEFTSLLTGTVSAGYGDRHYADPRLSVTVERPPKLACNWATLSGMRLVHGVLQAQP